MGDGRRWTIYVCPEHGPTTPWRDDDEPDLPPMCGDDDCLEAVTETVVMPVGDGEAESEAASLREALEEMHDSTERFSHFNGVATARKKARAVLDRTEQEKPA